MTPCKNIRAALDDWLDDRADAQVRAEIDTHLAKCDDCARFFKHHRELADDLLALAGAANRIADAPTGIARPRRRRSRTAWGVAAAIFLLIGAGMYVARFRQDGIVTPPPERRMAELPAFHVKVPEKKLAVPIKSTNPRIHIVWFYNETLLPDAADTDAADDASSQPS